MRDQLLRHLFGPFELTAQIMRVEDRCGVPDAVASDGRDLKHISASKGLMGVDLADRIAVDPNVIAFPEFAAGAGIANAIERNYLVVIVPKCCPRSDRETVTAGPTAFLYMGLLIHLLASVRFERKSWH